MFEWRRDGQRRFALRSENDFVPLKTSIPVFIPSVKASLLFFDYTHVIHCLMLCQYLIRPSALLLVAVKKYLTKNQSHIKIGVWFCDNKIAD